MTELFKSEPARSKVREWHDKFRARVVGQPVSREVETRFGKTHVLVAAPRTRRRSSRCTARSPARRSRS